MLTGRGCVRWRTVLSELNWDILTSRVAGSGLVLYVLILGFFTWRLFQLASPIVSRVCFWECEFFRDQYLLSGVCDWQLLNLSMHLLDTSVYLYRTLRHAFWRSWFQIWTRPPANAGVHKPWCQFSRTTVILWHLMFVGPQNGNFDSLLAPRILRWLPDFFGKKCETLG